MSAKNASAGNSKAAVHAANNPAIANSPAPRWPSYQIRHIAQSVIAAQTAAGKWLLNATANVVRNVPNVAAAMTRMRPQSLLPYLSIRLASTKKYRIIGTTFTSKMIARPISYGFVPRLTGTPLIEEATLQITQYGAARSVARIGGLLLYMCAWFALSVCMTASIVSQFGCVFGSVT